jgi:2'-5' RNA ligase
MDQPASQNFLRLFCAVELPPDVRARAAAHLAHLRASIDGPLKVSWEREEKMHVTLKFFGDVLAERMTQLSDSLARTASHFEPFTLRLAGCGVFASLSRPNVLWIGIADNSGRLATLQRDLEDECARVGFARDARRFHPHVTLARIRIVNGEARRLARLHTETEFEPISFRVSDLVLMRSELDVGGSRYTVLTRHELGATNEGVS